MENFNIISYGKTHIASKFYPEIITVDVVNEGLGKAAITILEELQNNTDVLNINMSVKSCINNQTNILSETISEFNDTFEENTSDIFYEDPQIQKMLLIEKLLSSCDAVDLLILDLVLKGYSYEDIANKNFLSYSAIKYRVRNMILACNCSTKSEFIKFMKTYV